MSFTSLFLSLLRLYSSSSSSASLTPRLPRLLGAMSKKSSISSNIINLFIRQKPRFLHKFYCKLLKHCCKNNKEVLESNGKFTGLTRNHDATAVKILFTKLLQLSYQNNKLKRLVLRIYNVLGTAYVD